MAAVFTDISAEPLDLSAAVTHVSDPQIGGIAMFVGTVRSSASVDSNHNRTVVSLNYEAHPTLAARRIEEIAATAGRKWDLTSVYAVHRTGACELAEPTVVVACGAEHRGDALEACRWIIDSIKAEVPIWKQEVYADAGDSAWVNTP